MIKPIVISNPTYCRNCNSESVDLYNNYDRPIGYYRILNECDFNKDMVIDRLSKEKSLSYMKCHICGSSYRIDWSMGLPRPLRNHEIIDKIHSGKIY